MLSKQREIEVGGEFSARETLFINVNRDYQICFGNREAILRRFRVYSGRNCLLQIGESNFFAEKYDSLNALAENFTDYLLNIKISVLVYTNV